MSEGASEANVSDGQQDVPAKTPSPSPPPLQPMIAPRHGAIDFTGVPRLTVLQEPQENFHKDEGGKANQLIFRVILQGELPADITSKGVDGALTLIVRPIFDDGSFAPNDVLDIVGGTDGANPCIVLRTRVGGLRYRFTTVSKRFNNKGMGVQVSVANCAAIEPIRSETTMVFSKRKNKEQRLEEQARERNEYLERERAAQLLLSARGSPSSQEAGSMLSASGGDRASGAGAPAPSISPPPGSGGIVTAPAPVNLRFPGSTQGTATLPPPFMHAAPAIVRPRPRRISREKETSSDSESSEATSQSRKRRRPHPPPQRSGMDDRIAKLEALVESNSKEIQELRDMLNMYLVNFGPGTLRRSSSQNVPWEFSEHGTHAFEQGPNRDTLMSANSLTMPSPQPVRSPFELDAWTNGSLESQLLRLKRDNSTSSSNIPSPRSASALGLPVPARRTVSGDFGLLNNNSTSAGNSAANAISSASTSTTKSG